MEDTFLVSPASREDTNNGGNQYTHINTIDDIDVMGY